MCNLYNITTSQEAMRRLFRVEHDTFGNLEPSLDVYPDRPAPVILTTADEIETWLNAPWDEAKSLQRPLAEDQLILLPVT